MKFFFSVFIACISLSCLANRVYINHKLPISVSIPHGWKASINVIDDQRQIKIIPRNADQRERAAIQVKIVINHLDKTKTLAQYVRDIAANGKQIINIRYPSKRRDRIEVDFRSGHYFTAELWIMQHTKMVLQRIDATHLIDARCTANISEYLTYRRSLDAICKSVQILK